MPRKAKFKVRLNPLGAVHLSRKTARKVTSRFHNITHRLEVLASDSANNITGDSIDHANSIEKEKAKLQENLIALGGRKAYQDASIVSTQYFNTAHWVFQNLTQLKLRPGKNQSPLNVLEIGAINQQLCVPWLKVTGIDILSRHPNIRQIDFFDFDTPMGEYDIIVNSMVINCVETPLKRGLMLQMCFAHLRPGGYMFLNLPLRCLNVSRYITGELFAILLKILGFAIVVEKMTPKVAMFCLQRNGGNAVSSTVSDLEMVVPAPGNAESVLMKRTASTAAFSAETPQEHPAKRVAKTPGCVSASSSATCKITVSPELPCVTDIRFADPPRLRRGVDSHSGKFTEFAITFSQS